MIKIFLFTVKYTNLLGSSPLRVDHRRGKLYVHFWSHFRTFHLWAWFTAYSIIVLPTNCYVLHITDQKRKLNFTIIVTIACLMCSIITGTLTFRPKGWCQIFNCLFKFIPDFGTKYRSCQDNKLDGLENRLLEAAMVTIYSVTALVGYLAAIDCLLRPYRSTYLLFNISPRLVSWPLYFIACGWYGSFAIAFTSVLGMIGSTAVFMFFYTMQILGRELRMGLKTYKTDAILRKNPQNLITVWRSIEVLTKLLNVEVCYALLYMQTCVVGISLFTTVTLVYQWSQTDLFLRLILMFCGTMAPVGWCIFLILAGLQYKWGLETLSTWKPDYWQKPIDLKYMKRQRWATRPFSLGDGKRYFIRPISILTFLRSLSRNTFRALITYGDVMGYT